MKKKIIYTSTISSFLKKKLIGDNMIIKNSSSYNNPKKFTFIFYERHDLNIVKKINHQKKKILVLCEKKYKKLFKTNLIITQEPRIDFTKIMDKFFSKNNMKKSHIHKTVQIGLNCSIGDNVSIGKRTIIANNVSIENNSKIGKNCKINSGCVIGADGFGPIIKNKKVVKMQPHYGGVNIGDNVYIGPLTNIERGTINKTIIENNVAIDALVQIGHNSKIKKNSVITAGSLIGGGVIVEEGSWIAPNSTIKERVKIKKNSMIGYASNVLVSTRSNSVNYGNPSKQHIKKIKNKR
jgi:UDP-3-O-[3-hydroxymyristoyl] glucosamine N-acyltransferase